MKRVYHQWTNEESCRLFKIVLKCKKDWQQVQIQFPEFTKLQLQNKFFVMQRKMQNYKTKKTDSSVDSNLLKEIMVLFKSQPQ
ncbi:Myb-like_DNA-binding domain-containing protein [Hexamita inflata]|uniref:Myb-like DNA-binding domain-containing protein n=1 Tax=Hexamita inflata TaxID=28002 RepID=A0AA86PHG2_9EUKA|nr:Myb-like DNA-binding domain-containing protein [Hexamita inflata]CAI9937278.1 Myb-like DNA-binding domain-containing protein [Hexamita inflata]